MIATIDKPVKVLAFYAESVMPTKFFCHFRSERKKIIKTDFSSRPDQTKKKTAVRNLYRTF